MQGIAISYYVEEQSSLIREYLLTGARDDKQKVEQLARMGDELQHLVAKFKV